MSLMLPVNRFFKDYEFEILSGNMASVCDFSRHSSLVISLTVLRFKVLDNNF